jgi:TolB protein
VTHLNKASFAPYFFPDGKRIIFASNVADPKGRDFDLYTINVDGTGLECITYNNTFDGFPMFSPNGKKLVFASNRNGSVQGETNIFIADWVE